MNIKAISFDIDNTLTSELDHKIPSSAIEACRLLNQKGIKIIIATGRSLGSLSALSDYISPDYYIGAGGAIIEDENNTILWQDTYSREEYDDICNYCCQNDIGMLWKFPQGGYGLNNDAFWQKLINDGEEIHVGITEEMNCLPNSLSLYCSEKNVEKFKEHYKNSLKICFGGHYVYDVEKIGVDKGNCLMRLSEMLNIPSENIAAFGDSENDLSILEKAGLAIAVGNAMDSVKKQADIVTDKASEDGIYNALKNLEII